MNLDQFLQMLEGSIKRVPVVANLAVKATVEAVAVEAKAYIGHELREWPALAESTIIAKKRLGYTGQLSPTDPLLRTAQMRESISASVDGWAGIVGSTDKVAVYQELGTARIPPRPFISTSMFRAQPVAEIFFGKAATSLLAPRGSIR